ncbi:NIPSNAP family protein [Alphaproteobacteria bacterium]|nr:NIPSNAP family protein [Alphaproteobacteria bacterium]
MIIEMRTYTIKPGELHNFIKIYDNSIRDIHTEILGNQIGFFYTEIGNVNEVIHLYGYDSYEDRESRREVLSKRPEFKAYLNEVKNLIVDMKNQLMTPASFSKIK